MNRTRYVLGGEETSLQLGVTQLSRLRPAQPRCLGPHQIITHGAAGDIAAPDYLPLGKTAGML
jgi:hypothetical protein